MFAMDVPARPPQAMTDGLLRSRHDWVRGEVRCLMCGRLLGRLLGSAQQHENGDHSAGRPVAFIAFRPLDPTGPIVRFTPGLRFRCTLCSGAGALADVEVFSTYDEPPPHPSSEDEEHAEERRPRGRPGRPPRPLPPITSSGLNSALLAF